MTGEDKPNWNDTENENSFRQINSLVETSSMNETWGEKKDQAGRQDRGIRSFLKNMWEFWNTM